MRPQGAADGVQLYIFIFNTVVKSAGYHLVNIPTFYASTNCGIQPVSYWARPFLP